MINQQTQTLLDAFTKIPLFQLIEAKKEDTFDIEGIENPKMRIVEYQALKSFLINKMTDITQ